jgi:hypothetical protein
MDAHFQKICAGPTQAHWIHGLSNQLTAMMQAQEDDNFAGGVI